MEKAIDVSNKYSHEILQIQNKLNQLEKGRIYEFSKAQMDGYLATNIQQLKDMLNDLINKIEYDKESTSEMLAKVIKQSKI